MCSVLGVHPTCHISEVVKRSGIQFRFRLEEFVMLCTGLRRTYLAALLCEAIGDHARKAEIEKHLHDARGIFATRCMTAQRDDRRADCGHFGMVRKEDRNTS